MTDRHLVPPRPGLLVSEGPGYEVRYFHGRGLDGKSGDRRHPYSVWEDTGMAGRYRWRVLHFCTTEKEAMEFVQQALTIRVAPRRVEKQQPSPAP